MEKELFDYVAERAEVLSKSGASTQVTKDAAQAWLDAVAAEGEAAADEATPKMLDILEGRPTTIDGLIGFLQSPVAQEMFGEEGAAKALEGARARKDAGAKYCNCEACTAASELLAKFGRIEL